MNKTTLQHTLTALGAMAVILIVGLLFNTHLGQLWLGLGGGVGIGLFLGREHAQAEYRWISQFGDGKRANMPWWGAFDVRVWQQLDPWLDWIAPLLGCGLMMTLFI